MLSDKIIKWLKDRVQSAGAKGVVLGLSGGIDSAVVAVLSKKAFDDNALSIIIPCYSSVQDIKDAELLITKFDLRSEKIELSAIYDSLLEIFPRSDKNVHANLKARLRMLTLYYFSNKYNYLVVGTGNKSEITVGYFTKYGDGGADILPLGGLLKREVRSLASELKIPDNIINKPPSAGLWVGQTDEDEMEISYDELDEAIVKMEKGEKIKSDILQKVMELIKRSTHKKQPIPIFQE